MKVGSKASTSVDAIIGARIRARRRQFGITQAGLAHRLGITFQQVQKYETGKNRVGASRLSAIATQLDVPVSFFFEEQEGTNQVSLSPAYEMVAGMRKPEFIELNTAFQKIKDPRRRQTISTGLSERLA